MRLDLKILATLPMLALLAGCATTAPPPPPTPVATADKPPRDSQYLYGSAEALAISRQSYAMLMEYVRTHLAGQQASVMVDPASPADAPRFLPCDGKPPAAVFDMDETSILNIGGQYYEARGSGAPFDKARWDRWETEGDLKAVAAVPGAAEAFAALRRLGVTVIVNSNRDAFAARHSADALAASGLGAFVHRETLWLAGDVAEPNKGGKDARRLEIMKTHCIVAMAGDQLVDFSDRFIGSDPVARRALAASAPYASRWGHGWFVLPNPVYGSAVQGTWDQVFPPATRWADPGAGRQ